MAGPALAFEETLLAPLALEGHIALLRAPSKRQFERAEAKMLRLPQVNCPLEHHFSDGVYVRECFMPAGSLILGHRHKTRHLNFVWFGRAQVMLDGVVSEISGRSVFESQPGVRKLLYIEEDMLWSTIHVTPERDLKKLEAELIEKSDAFEDHQSRQIEEFQSLLRLRMKNPAFQLPA